ncbi:hypothetical protein JL721_11223 [Aureococcus anophagefferens]|nr:hypothetical protein JL721_11223 [Aureococcus anophagefferens]
MVLRMLVVATAHFRYCNGIKEGFNTNHREGRVLTKAHLKRCAERNEMLSHVKPSHLSPEDKRDHLNTPEKLMRAARELGYEVIVAEYRANALARMVSSWEMKPRSAADTKAQFCLPAATSSEGWTRSTSSGSAASARRSTSG